MDSPLEGGPCIGPVLARGAWDSTDIVGPGMLADAIV